MYCENVKTSASNSIIELCNAHNACQPPFKLCVGWHVCNKIKVTFDFSKELKKKYECNI